MGIAPSGDTPAGTIDFFAAQEAAARRARRLFALVLVCAALVVFSVDLWLGLFAGHMIAHDLWVKGRDVLAEGPYWQLLLLMPLEAYGAITVVVLAIMLGANMKRARQLQKGAAEFAQSLGARAVNRDKPFEQERQLLHVADEMALAAQLLPPALYVLDKEPAINALAFTAGDGDAAVILTQGAVLHLPRAELQALLASALGRLHNGDVELNVRLIAWLAGLTAVGAIGTALMRLPFQAGSKATNRDGEVNDLGKAAFAFGVAFAMVGGVIAIIGYAGFALARWIRALGARQRVLLADATALQFTRDPAAVIALLQRLQQAGTQRMAGRYREETGPLLFVPAVGWRCLATHPSLVKRIAALQQH